MIEVLIALHLILNTRSFTSYVLIPILLIKSDIIDFNYSQTLIDNSTYIICGLMLSEFGISIWNNIITMIVAFLNIGIIAYLEN